MDDEQEPPQIPDSDWKLKAKQLLLRLPKGWKGTAEDIRMELRKMGLPRPHSPAVWGSLTSTFMRLGYLQRTGKRRPMREFKSHGRMTDVYERT